MFGFDRKQEDKVFNGRFFQGTVNKRGGGDIEKAFAGLLDCQMLQHKLDTEIHMQRMAELREIEKRITENQPNK